MTLTVRSATVTGATTKGSALTHAELDENFNHLRQASNITVTQSGSGATSGTVQGELRRTVWLEQYGGGTGETAATNDTAFSRAHTFLSSGGVIMLGRGTYAFSTDWISITDNITIKGQGIGATTLQYAGTGHGLVLDAVNWNSIQDLTVDMNSSAGSNSGIKVAGSWYTYMRNVRVIKALESGVLVQDAENDDTTQRGSYFTHLSHVFLGDSSAGNRDGLLLNSTGSGGVTFTKLSNVYCSFNTRYGASFQGAASPASVTVVTWVGGGSNSNTSEGIRMQDGSSTNRAFDVTLIGVDLEGNGVNPTITTDATCKGLNVIGISGGTYDTNIKQIVDLSRSKGGIPQWWQGTGENPFTFNTHEVPGVKLVGKVAGAACELQIDNAVAASGRNWGLSSATNGVLQIVDRTGAVVIVHVGANDVTFAKPIFMSASRLHEAQGAAVASANDLTLGADGNRFQISGTTQINLIASTNWQGGSTVTLHFQGSVTVMHDQAANGAFKPLMLSGAVDFSATVNDQLTLQYDSTASKWFEISRTVI